MKNQKPAISLLNNNDKKREVGLKKEDWEKKRDYGGRGRIRICDLYDVNVAL